MWTEDLSATIDFYVEKLGFTCRELNEKWGWASLNLDEAWIMLTRPNEHTTYEKIGFTGSFYFNTDDVDTLWNELKESIEERIGESTYFWSTALRTLRSMLV